MLQWIRLNDFSFTNCFWECIKVNLQRRNVFFLFTAVRTPNPAYILSCYNSRSSTFRHFVFPCWIWGCYAVVCEEYVSRAEEKAKQETNRNRATLSLSHISAYFLFNLLFDPEYGDGMFLRNVGLSPNYTAIRSKGPCFSCSLSHCLNTGGHCFNRYIKCIFTLNKIPIMQCSVL
jgi:hypothetical protein